MDTLRCVWPPRAGLLVIAATVAACALGCVDLSKPWEGVDTMAGTGGHSLGGAPAFDGPHDTGAGGGLDSGSGGAGGRVDAPSGGVTVEVGPGGAGGRSGFDGPILDSGSSDLDGGADVPLPGTGGSGAGGAAGTGGKGSGGSRGTGGAGTGGKSTGVSGTGGKGTGGNGTGGKGTGGSGTGGSGTGGKGTGGSGTGGSVVGTGGAIMSGLVAYYKCNETSGSTLTDSSGNGNHGTLNGGYSFGAGKVGGALILAKSSSSYAELPKDLFASLGDLTIAAWIYVNTADTWPRVIDTGVFQGGNPAPETGTKYMNLTPRDKNGNLRWSITTNGWGSEESLNTAALSAGAWKHVTIVLVESSALGWLYVDGAVVQSDENTNQQPNDLGDIDYAYLGRSQFPADPYFDGKLDEIRVYSRALSATEIQALYNFTGP